MAGPKISVGKVEVISLVDTPFEIPWQIFFPHQREDEFAAYRELYPSSFSEGRFRTQAGCYALRSQGKTILCDSGIGPGPIDFLGGVRGRLLDDMRDKGVEPEDVDTVVFTHLHGDHVGWNIRRDGKPNFPKSKYLVPQADWDFFSKNPDANPQIRQVTPLKDLGSLELFSGERSLTTEVSTFPTPGHTPGHTSLLVNSAGERAVITGDLAHHPAQTDRIEWCASFDTDHPATTETRRRVFDQIESERLIAAFCHFPEPFGRLVRLEGKRVFRAL